MTARRPKATAREALGEVFARDLLKSWRKNGPAALETVRADKPDLYVKLVTAMLPKEAASKATETDDLDEAALDRRIASLAAALGLAIGSREGPGNQDAAPDEKAAGPI